MTKVAIFVVIAHRTYFVRNFASGALQNIHVNKASRLHVKPLKDNLCCLQKLTLFCDL